jgi:acetyl esterase/lipase
VRSVHLNKRFIFIAASIALACSLLLLAAMRIYQVHLRKDMVAKCRSYQIMGPRGALGISVIAASKLAQPTDATVVVYLHGLGGNKSEPFKFPSREPFALAAMEKFPNIAFASCDYGTAGSWSHKVDLDDITSGITYLSKIIPFSRIIMAGSSMGGSFALTYATMAPKEVRDKIIGVAAIYPVGDFVELYRTTSEPVIKCALEKGFGGTPESARDRYLDSSFLTHLSSFPAKAKVYIVSSLKDTVCPTPLQNELTSKLRSNSTPVEIETFAGTHMQPPPGDCFQRALQFIVTPGR